MAWSPGDPVVLREVWRGKVWAARPTTVVRDDPDLRMFHAAPEWTWKCPAGPDGEWLRLPAEGWTLRDRDYGWRILSFSRPGIAHAVLAYWDPETDEFRRWYINLEEPLRPTPLGFDYLDHALDIVVAPDRSSWEWKDEDELEEAVERGLFSVEQAGEFRAEGRRAVERLLRGDPPFDRDWRDWRPDPAWAEPALPPGWEVVA
ncbi:MAG: DUF402 domain-containing protein [Actinobacteria bacterium]|nr:DUF402 domain-containing protein [Actinomycetota bacterium]